MMAGSMPVTNRPRSNSTWLAPPGELPISTQRSPDLMGNSDQRRASSIFSQARETASAGSSIGHKPPGKRDTGD